MSFSPYNEGKHEMARNKIPRPNHWQIIRESDPHCRCNLHHITKMGGPVYMYEYVITYYIHIYICMNMWLHIYIYTYEYVITCTHHVSRVFEVWYLPYNENGGSCVCRKKIGICVCMNMWLHIYMYVWICDYIHTCMYEYVITYTHNVSHIFEVWNSPYNENESFCVYRIYVKV